MEELLRDNLLKINSLYALDSWKHPNDLSLDQKGVVLYGLTETSLKQVSSFATPDEVLAVFEIPPTIEPTYSGKWILYLDGISDPGNLGTILRSAEWFGVQHVILSPGSVDCFNPKCIQASMGSIGRVHIHYLDFNLISEIVPPEFPIYLAETNGVAAQSLKIDHPSILVIGSESHGLSKKRYQKDSISICIPKHPNSKAESLNAAMAATALLALLS